MNGELHFVCCDEDLALCGEDLAGGEFEFSDDVVTCTGCWHIHEAGVPCGAPFCRLRSWWRDRWAS